MRTYLKPNYPIGWHLYAVLTVASSLLIPLGLHRKFYVLMNDLSIPSLVAAALTGMANLSWYELAYIVGGGLKSVLVFTLLPFVGSATGLLSVLLLFTNVRWRRQLLFAHLAFGLTVSTLSLMGLLWRGFEDYWRSVTIISFLLTYTAWIFYFLRTRLHFNRA
jgi:hypothetical protein